MKRQMESTMKLIVLLGLMCPVFAFAGNLDSSPKEVLIQESISKKVKITLPELDIKDFKVRCSKQYSLYSCYLSYKGKPNSVTIGNSTYNVNIHNQGSILLDYDLSIHPVSWSVFGLKGENDNSFGFTYEFSESETELYFSLYLTNSKSYTSIGSESPKAIILNNYE